MANPEHVAKLRDGIDAWNTWRIDNQGVVLDITRANLTGMNLCGVNLGNVDLTESILNNVNLSRSNLFRANLSKAELFEANLCDADLSEANLNEAKLWRANLSKSNLFRSNFSEAILSGANLNQATIGFTIFGYVDFRGVKSLDTVNHHTFSIIGIDTLYRSKGNIPESFLRGCGVPEKMIEYAKSLTTNPIDFYSCFISHSTKDDALARRLHADLQAKGVRCWFAPHDMRSGRKVHHQIDEAIKVYDKLLLILSEDSMSSNWVGAEIIKAKKKEDRRGTQMLFPIGIVPFHKVKKWEFFDSDSGRDLAREIREYHIPDFSMWKTDHDAYQEAFDRLLRDLKA